MQYKIYYDILRSGSGVEGEIFGFLIAVIAGAILLVRSLRRQNHFQKIFMTIWFIFFVGLGSFGFGNVYYQHYHCSQWARSGNYEVVEGSVKSFVKYDRNVREQFSIKTIHFEYSSHDLSVCGFKQLAIEGSPIREGLLVRITYRDGRILKLELAENQGDSNYHIRGND